MASSVGVALIALAFVFVLLRTDGDQPGAGDRTHRVLQTVEVDLDGEGTVDQARRHLRTEGPGDAPTIAEEVIAGDEVPLEVRIRYEIDGLAVAPDQLGDRAGTAVVGVEVRNLDTQARSITYGTPEGLVEETVEVAAPLLADVTVDLGEGWSQATTDDGMVSVGPDGGTQVYWQAALFPPIGSTDARFELDAVADGGSAPRITVEARPVTTRSSPVTGIADELLTERATSDAVSAVLAAGLQDAVAAAGEGADGLTEGVGRLQAGISDALDEVDGLDPAGLVQDALDGIGDQLDTQELVDELLAEALPDLPDAQRLADRIDTGALLAEAGLDAMFADVLADAVPDPEDLDPDALGLEPEALLTGIDLDDALGAALDELDLRRLFDALIEDLRVDALLADELAAIDLSEALNEVFADVDPEALLDAVDLDGVIASVLDGVADELTGPFAGIDDPEVLLGRLEDAIGGRSLGELIGAAELGPLVTTLLGTDELEVEVAALLSVLLDDIGLPVPATLAPELDELLGLVTAELELATGLVAAVGGLANRLDTAGPDADHAEPAGAPALLASSLAERLRDTSDVLAVADGAAFDDLDRALDTTSDRLGEAGEVLIELQVETAGDASALEPLAEAFAAAEVALAEAGTQAEHARESSEATVAGIAAELPRVAAGLDDLADVMTSTATRGDAELPERIRQDVSTLGDGLDELRTGIAGLADPIDELLHELAATPDPFAELGRRLDDTTLDLAPAVASFQERAAARLAEVRFDELPLSDLAAAFDLDVDALNTELIGAFDQAALTDLLAPALADLDLDTGLLLEALDLDTEALLAPLVAELPDLSDLLAEVDPGPLLDAVDVAELLGPDVAEQLAASLAPDPGDLAMLLDTAFAAFEPPEIDELLEELDLDLAELFEAAGVGPEALLGDLEPPDDDALLDALDLQPDELVEELGIDTLGELDELSAGLIEGLTGLADGAEALTEGLEVVADDGLAELVGQLDDDNREAQRDLALLRELDERATVHATDVPAGEVASAVRYRLVSEPGNRVGTLAVLTGGAAAVAALGVLALRRRSSAGAPD